MDPFSKEALLSAEEALFAMPRRVRLHEVDSTGRIYFARVLEYFGDAFTEMLLTRGVDVPAHHRRGDWVAPLVHAEADYLAPIRFCDDVIVELAATRLTRSAATLGMRIRGADGAWAAFGHLVHVFTDPATQRSRPIPDDVRAVLSGAGARP